MPALASTQMDSALNQAPARCARRLLPALALAAFAGSLACYAAGVVLGGGAWHGLLLYPLAFGLCLWLPGLWLAGLALPGAGFPLRAVVALPLGGLALMLLFQLTGAFLPAWAGALPMAGAGLWYAFRHRAALRRFRLPAIPPGAWGLLLLFSAGLFLYVFTGVFPYAKPQNAGNMLYSQDLLWSVGNAAGAAYGSPVRDLRVAGGVLHYHYFIDVLDGLVGLVAGQSAWDAVAYYCWPLWCAALLAALYLIARGFGTGQWAALLAPGGLLFAHVTWATSFSHVFVNANGVVQSNFLLAAAVLIVQQAQREDFKSGRSLAAMLAAGGALAWGKSTIGLLLACGLLAAFLVGGLAQRRWRLWLLAAGAGVAAIFGLLYLLIYRHAINNLVFQPRAAALADGLGILGLHYWPGLVLYLASLALALRHFGRLGGDELLVHALAPGGLVAYVLFSHYSFSQSYFLLAASFAMWMCAARLFAPQKGKTPAWHGKAKPALAAALALLCAAAFALTLAAAAPVLRRGAQIALRTLGLRPAFAAEAQSVTPDDEAAADWLRANMGPDEVFATNRNARDPAAADGIFHYYTAASQRQAYVESWRYAMDYSLEYHLLRHHLEVVSDGVFAAPTFAEARALAAENGIAYLVLHLPSGGAAWPEATPVFASPTVLIYALN